MITIYINQEDLKQNPEQAMDKALNLLKKKMSPTLKLIKDKRYYRKPSEIKHEQDTKRKRKQQHYRDSKKG